MSLARLHRMSRCWPGRTFAAWWERNEFVDLRSPKAVEILARVLERRRTELHADEAPRKIVGRRMDAAPKPRQAALIRCIRVLRPFEREIDARPVLEDEKLVLPHHELALPAREIRITGEECHELGRRARVRRVPGDITGERRCHKGRALIGPPILRENPADARNVEVRVADVCGSAPSPELDLADV